MEEILLIALGGIAGITCSSSIVCAIFVVVIIGSIYMDGRG